MKPMKKGKLHNVVHLLRCKEYGVKSFSRHNMKMLRKVLFGDDSSWENGVVVKSDGLAFSLDDMAFVKIKPGLCKEKNYVVLKFLRSLSVKNLYFLNIPSTIKDLIDCQSVPTTYQSTYPRCEYQSTLLVLLRNNVLVRYDLNTGEIYETIQLSTIHRMVKIEASFLTNQFTINSSNIIYPNTYEIGTFIKIYSFHPFKWQNDVEITGMVFPDAENKKNFGLMKNVEIMDQLVVLVTRLNYIFIYSLKHLLEMNEVCPKTTPPILLFIESFNEVMNIGGCPFTSISCFDPATFSVTRLGQEDNLKVSFPEMCGQQITNDDLTFHPDDSNRMIHKRNSDLRILSLYKENDGKLNFKEIFRYDTPAVTERKDTTRYGRLVKSKFIIDNNVNRRLHCAYENELDVFVILESFRLWDGRYIKLEKITFYDNQTFEVLDSTSLCLCVPGDIETSFTTITMDRDLVNISIKSGVKTTFFHFQWHKNTQEVKDYLSKKEKKNLLGKNMWNLIIKNDTTILSPQRNHNKLYYVDDRTNSESSDEEWANLVNGI